MENTKFVFVNLYIMLGDADGSIDGCRVMSRKGWDKDVEEFNKYLLEEEVDEVEGESEFGTYTVSMENYEVKPCTAEEAKLLEKFLGTIQGDFRLPTEFI